MRKGSLRFYAGCIAAFATSIAAVVACGSSSDATSAFAPSGTDSGATADSSRPDAGSQPEDASTIPANGIVIVHAASFGAFRLCFEGADSRPPIPSADLLPQSNLLGVDVGSVVRIDPLPSPPKRIWAFAVDDIKDFYPPGKTGPACKDLVGGAGFKYAHEVATIEESLASGVHLLVLRGSLADQDLRIEKITLMAFDRSPDTLPVQVLPLSRDLPARAGGRKVGVVAGDVASDGGDAGTTAPFVEGAFPFGTVVPTLPVLLPYDPADEGAYATSGFSVTLGDSLDAGAKDAGDAAAREVILRQSLADIQRLSAPRALPADWFASASSYVLLLLGSAQETDAAADDLSKLHFLAIPLAAAPSGDASIEDAATD